MIVENLTAQYQESQEPAGLEWHVLWTHSHFEQLVHDQLAARGFELFLPKINVWSRRGGVRRLCRVPMFPGYLFLHHAMDKTSYIEVRKARGLAQVLGQRWDRLSAVPEREIETIQRVHAADLPAMPHPFLREGQRVRITRGPLTDVEGILVRVKPNKGLLVVSINLLQRSVAVEVDCTLVEVA
ncbi:MAG: transcription termination/antitermination protein NusG [bacterium]